MVYVYDIIVEQFYDHIYNAVCNAAILASLQTILSVGIADRM